VDTYCTWNRLLAEKEKVELYDAKRMRHASVSVLKAEGITQFEDFGGNKIKSLDCGDASVIVAGTHCVLTGGSNDTRVTNADKFQRLYGERASFYALKIEDEAQLTWDSCRDAVQDHIKDRPLAMVAFGSTDTHASLANEHGAIKFKSIQTENAASRDTLCTGIARMKPKAILLAGSSAYLYDLKEPGVHEVTKLDFKTDGRKDPYAEKQLIAACRANVPGVRLYVNKRA
jgi:hypothetical protein